jgi:hypothetical protein
MPTVFRSNSTWIWVTIAGVALRDGAVSTGLESNSNRYLLPDDLGGSVSPSLPKQLRQLRDVDGDPPMPAPLIDVIPEREVLEPGAP